MVQTIILSQWTEQMQMTRLGQWRGLVQLVGDAGHRVCMISAGQDPKPAKDYPVPPPPPILAVRALLPPPPTLAPLLSPPITHRCLAEAL